LRAWTRESGRLLLWAGFAAVPGAAFAQNAAQNPAEQLETPSVEVIGVTPLPGFGVPAALVQPIFQPAVAELPGISVYLAWVEDDPVSTAVSSLGPGGVGIFNVATPPHLRGRGYGAAVTARAAEDGFAAHAELAWLQASPLGEPVYRRMGFRQVDTHLLLTRPRSIEPA